MRQLLSGTVAWGSAVIALFFLKFQRRTGDRLFAFFAGAFILLALNGAALVIARPDGDIRAIVYSVRLSAFVLILLAIIDRNRRP